MPGCCVPNCKNRTENGIRLFGLPQGEKNMHRRKVWLQFIGRGELPSRASICEQHFDENQFENKRKDNRKLLKCNAIPTISLENIESGQKQPRKVLEQIMSEVPTSRDVASGLENDDNQLTINSEILVADVEDNGVGNNCKNTASDGNFVTNLQFDDLKSKLRASHKKIKLLESKIEEMEKNYSQIFNTDQMYFLRNGTHKGMEWSDDTINKSLKLYMACGAKGYDEMRRQHFPLPSIRTLQHRIRNFKCQPGVLEEILQLLKIKVSSFREEEKHASLLLDEMAIHPSLQYDNSTHKIIGRPTMKLSGNQDSSKEIATHALVFMLSGVSSHWKQTVAYEYTANSYSCEEVLQKIFDIIKQSENIGVRIKTVKSDMGPQNRAFWRKLNIVAHRHGKIKNFCPHPTVVDKKLYVMPNPVHIYKNIANALVKHRIFYLSEETVEKYKLPSNIIDVNAAEKVFEIESNQELKIAPRLKECIFSPNHFDKMNVNTAFGLLHHDTATAIRYYTKKNKLETKHETMAWFCEIIYKWFTLLTARHPKMGLCVKNEEIYNKTITFLNEFMEIIRGLFVKNGNWQPFQCGLLLATQTALDLQNDYLIFENFNFLLLGRFTQDALENLFSVVRARTPIPGPRDFKTSLRLIILSQYEMKVIHGNYWIDGSEHLVKYLKELPTSLHFTREDTEMDDLTQLGVPANSIEENTEDVEDCLYYLLGSILQKVKKTTCCSCYEPLLHSFTSTTKIEGVSLLTNLKSYKENILVYPSLDLFNYVKEAESYFTQNKSKLLNNTITYEDLTNSFLKEYHFIAANKCHNVIFKIINLYFKTRFFCITCYK